MAAVMTRGSFAGYATSLRLWDGSYRRRPTNAPPVITSAVVLETVGSRRVCTVNNLAGVRPAAPPWLGLLPCALLPGLALRTHHPTPQHFTLRLVVRGFRAPPHSSAHCCRLVRGSARMVTFSAALLWRFAPWRNCAATAGTPAPRVRAGGDPRPAFQPLPRPYGAESGSALRAPFFNGSAVGS